ncbi:MAG: hypothetical protein NVSMB64_15590 [Candidatus Velthaea sp.]
MLYIRVMTQRQYVQRMTIFLLAYAAVLFASISLVRGPLGGSPVSVRVVVGLSPMLPAVGLLFAFMSRFRGMDELQRNIQSEGLSFAVGATAIITFSYGFLQISAGAPDLSWFWVWPILAFSWMFGSALARRRYR